MAFEPNKYQAFLGEGIKPTTFSSGSDQTKSVKIPDYGISDILSVYLMMSKFCKSGESPPWKHKIEFSIVAA